MEADDFNRQQHKKDACKPGYYHRCSQYIQLEGEKDPQHNHRYTYTPASYEHLCRLFEKETADQGRNDEKRKYLSLRETVVDKVAKQVEITGGSQFLTVEAIK